MPSEDGLSDLEFLFVRLCQAPIASKADSSVSSDSIKTWRGDEFWIMVAFDDTGRTTAVFLWQVVSESPSWLDRLRARVGLL
jgi:hypothetical protein